MSIPPVMTEYELFAIDLAREAARVSLPYFRGAYEETDKGGPGAFDPVTQADREAEAAIRVLIAARYPDHGVIGEEYGEDRPDADHVWILDPIDGTRAFIAGLPLWTTLIGLRHEGRPVLGSIGQPYLDEIFLGGPSGARAPAGGSSFSLPGTSAAGSARSDLLSSLRQGRLRKRRSSPIIGLLLASGRRASVTSMTTSVDAMASAAFLRAEAMCPGNHWMGMEKT